MHIPNEEVSPLAGSDHRTICKFSANEDQRFSPLGDAVVRLVEQSLSLTEGKIDQSINTTSCAWEQIN